MSPSTMRLPSWIRRVLRRQRGAAVATTLIVVTLALALGANTAVFSLADALLVRAVPFAHPDRLVAVTTGFPGIRLTGMGLSGPEAKELAQLTGTFAAVGPYLFSGYTVQGTSDAEQANTIELSAEAAGALGLTPLVGRVFAPGEYARGGAPVLLLGHAFWRRVFGGDPATVGRSVRIAGTVREVIGVMPPGVTLLNRPVDVWLPLAIEPDAARADHRFAVVGRLADGRTLADAVADLQHAMEIWREETGEMHTPSAKLHPLAIEPLTRATTGLTREPIGALVAAVAFVLLIACANVSNLLVARAERRRVEVAIQLALGASRRRLLIDSVIEGVTLALAGSLGGVALSHGIIRALEALWPVAANAGPAIDYRVLGATAAVAIAAGVIIGAAPVLRLDLTRAGAWLKGGARRVGSGSRQRLQQSLVALQVALAVLLSGCAGLMVRSLLGLTAIDTGVDPNHVLRAHIALPDTSYFEDTHVWAFYDRVLAQARTLPGVRGAAVMSGLLPLRRANNTSFLLDGQELVDHSSIHQVDFIQHVSPDYLSMLRIPVFEGRDLRPADDERGAPVALVNRTLATRFWPGENALGKRLKPAGTGPWFTVVGVVGDVRQSGVQAPPGTEVYVAHRQARQLFSGYMPRSMNVVLRMEGESTAVAAALREQVKQVDPSAAVSGVLPLRDVIDRTIAQPRLLAWTFGAFATLALVVAGLGVYGVTSFVAASRTSEFGVRMALGALPSDALRLIGRAGAPVVALGIAAGMAGAIGAGRLLQSLLFGVAPVDVLSLGMGAAFIAITAGVAMLVPAVRAMRVDPLAALREP